MAKKRRSKTTRAQAKSVLARHAERLRKRGAHAMRITSNTSGYVIEVYVPEDFKGTLPSKVGATVRGTRVNLPVKARKTPRFKAERL